MPESQSPVEKVSNPELNRQILSYLDILSASLQKKGLSTLEIQGDSAILKTDQKELTRINPNEIILAGVSGVEDKILVAGQSETKVKSSGFESFVGELGESLIRLNHLGINYFCSDLTQETDAVKEITAQSGFSLYEEDSGNQYQKWFFIGGDLEDWQQPIFEMVLTQNESQTPDYWVPHFQIDLDTNLSIEELELLTEKHFGKGFLQWKLNVDNVGTVLAMGTIDNIGGTKIALGLGTDKRGTEWHRKHGLHKA